MFSLQGRGLKERLVIKNLFLGFIFINLSQQILLLDKMSLICIVKIPAWTFSSDLDQICIVTFVTFNFH